MADVFRALALDGGGIRGVIPATVLVALEERLGATRIAEAFDLIVGTSTGGILALGLTTPSGGRPRHAARELLALYSTEAETIFPSGGPPNLTQHIFGTRHPGEWLKNPGGILNRSGQRAGSIFGGNPKYAGGARYFARGLEEVLDHYVGDALLRDAVGDVVITSYDMAYDEPVLFSSRPRTGFLSDVPMRVVARATSAGPTYFEPQELADGERRRALVDGGVYVNNPAILGYLLGANAAAADGRPLIVVSVGTGTRNPANPRTVAQVKTSNWIAVARMVMEAAMTGGGELADALLRNLADGTRFRYWRIQTTVGECSFAMDDSTPANVACLANRGRQTVAEHEQEIAAIAAAI